jgi:ferritin-like metal-binding protein YciE
MADKPVANGKLVQYLNEAHGIEKRLETALEAHIAMTTKASYKNRLRQHLTETKRHARELEKRIKQLRGSAEKINVPGPNVLGDATQAVLGGAQKAVALAQGPVHALRGTGEKEKMLKNAKTEYASESEEIAGYMAIEKLAETLGDNDTRLLARAIRREEERMRSFLEKEIPRLTNDVAKAEIPAAQRRKAPRAKRTSRRKTARKKTTAAARKPARARTTATRKPARARTTSARKPARARTTSARKPARTRGASPRKPAGIKTPAVQLTGGAALG